MKVQMGWLFLILFLSASFRAASEDPVDNPSEKRLNNLVVELGQWPEAVLPFSFSNPRPGWIFIRATAGGSPLRSMTIASADGKYTRELNSTFSPGEFMALLEAKHYELRASYPESDQPLDIGIRAIPELQYCRFPCEMKFAEFGPLDWPFLEAHMLPNINTMVGNPAVDIDPCINAWTGAGRKWIGYYHLPRQEGLTGVQAFEYWTDHPGFQDPRLSGFLADEFAGRQNPWYPAWIEGMKLLGAAHAGSGRAFYGYCGGPGMYTRPQTREMVRTIFDQGYYMAYERYHHEEPSRPEMQVFMDRLLGREIENWRKTFPDCQRHMVMVLGLFAQGMGLNVQPGVDFKVHMDVQIQYLATHPGFEDLFGIHWWTSEYADEESVRWVGQLYRHYGIEGNTALLSEKYGYSYELAHIINPDFASELEGWQAFPATPGSMGTEYREYFARMQGRYWHRGIFPDVPAGDTCLWMERHPDAPNRAVQTVKGLRPGRLYSAKMISADGDDISGVVSKQKQVPVSLRIEGAEICADKCFQSPYSGQMAEPFKDQPPWFNLHRVLFRATGETATLIISDWPEDSSPLPFEQNRALVNFIEVQPYFSSDESS